MSGEQKGRLKKNPAKPTATATSPQANKDNWMEFEHIFQQKPESAEGGLHPGRNGGAPGGRVQPAAAPQ